MTTDDRRVSVTVAPEEITWPMVKAALTTLGVGHLTVEKVTVAISRDGNASVKVNYWLRPESTIRASMTWTVAPVTSERT